MFKHKHHYLFFIGLNLISFATNKAAVLENKIKINNQNNRIVTITHNPNMRCPLDIKNYNERTIKAIKYSHRDTSSSKIKPNTRYISNKDFIRKNIPSAIIKSSAFSQHETALNTLVNFIIKQKMYELQLLNDKKILIQYGCLSKEKKTTINYRLTIKNVKTSRQYLVVVHEQLDGTYQIINFKELPIVN